MVAIGFLFTALDGHADVPCHINNVMGALSISKKELKRLSEQYDIEWLDADHITVKGFETLKARIKTEKASKIDDMDYITVTAAAAILGEKLATLWKWIVYDGLMEYLQKGRRTLVRQSDVDKWKETLFFSQRHYSYTEIGKLYGVSRQTVRHWVMQGRIKAVFGPGGQKYILASELPECDELSEKAHQYDHRH